MLTANEWAAHVSDAELGPEFSYAFYLSQFGLTIEDVIGASAPVPSNPTASAAGRTSFGAGGVHPQAAVGVTASPSMENVVAPAVAAVIPGDDSPIGALLDAADQLWGGRDLGQVRISSAALENGADGIRFGTEGRIVLPPWMQQNGRR